MAKFVEVLPTLDRSKARGEHIVRISEALINKMKLGAYCVINRSFYEVQAYGEKRVDLNSYARVIKVSEGDFCKSWPEKKSVECIEVDQTLRAALGFPTDDVNEGVGGEVYVSKLSVSLISRFREWVSSLFGVRWIVLTQVSEFRISNKYCITCCK